jgi:hypothetical protein
LSPEEAQSLYFKYLSLNNLYHLVETFKQFDNDSLQDFIDYYDFIKENEITKEQLVEAIKMSNDLPNIREEYQEISDQLPDLQKEREFYISDNKLLISKNCELNNECNSLLSKMELQNRILEVIETELNKKRELLDTINNSEEYVTLKNIIEKQINDFLDHKKELLKLTAMTILKIMKEDSDKETLINNILNHKEYPDSEFYLISYEEKIADIAVDTLYNLALEINTNNILH